jgi:choline-sulfatase
VRRAALPGVLAALVLGALVGAAGCRGSASGPFPDAPVVLVSIDTLRSDHLAAYGYTRGSTPTLDAIAREGIVFERVFSHCPLTLPAHSSMFTGLLPPHHGVRDNLGFALEGSHRTLATRFKGAGLPTGGAVSAYVLRRATGIAQGFDLYDDAASSSLESPGAQRRDGAVATEVLGRWIEGQAGRRFFAFLHLYEPHAPYTPPEQHRGFADPYDGTVAYADELLGRLVARLRSRGLLDRVILAVTSDHGEGLRDHGEQEHGFFLYREVVQVPLVLRLPGARGAGRRVSGLVAQADLAPTLLDLAGLPHDGMDGVSQRGALDTGKASSRSVYSETYFPRYHYGWSELMAVTEERYRYVRAPRAELFDLGEDAGEKRNVAGERASTAAAMEQWLEREVSPGEAAKPGEVSPETREALQALGYVGGAEAAPTGGPLADPKDKLGVYQAYREAMDARREGRTEEAIAQLRAVVADSPGMLDAWETLGSIFVGLGRDKEAEAAFDQLLRNAGDHIPPHLQRTHLQVAKIERSRGDLPAAIASLRRALSLRPKDATAVSLLGTYLTEAGRAREAVTFLEPHVKGDPPDLDVLTAYGVALAAAGRRQEALALFEQARADHPTNAMVLVNVGTVLLMGGDLAGARQAFEAALGVDRDVARAHNSLGVIAAREGRLPEAIERWKRGAELDPHDYQTLFNLGSTLWGVGRRDEARPYLEAYLRAAPPALEARDIARVRALLGPGAGR